MRGVERLTTVVHYRLDPSLARELVRPPFQARAVGGAPLLSLAAIAMEGLQPATLPLPVGVSYFEALWRVSAELRGEPGGYVLRAAIDRPLIAALGRRLFRYPFEATAGTIARTDAEVRVELPGLRLAFDVVGGEAADPDEVAALGRGFAHTPDGRSWRVAIDHRPDRLLALAPRAVDPDGAARATGLPGGSLVFRSAAAALDSAHHCHPAAPVEA